MRYKYGEVVFVSDLTPFILKKQFLIIRIRTMASELSTMFAKSHELENEIRKKLGAIGYEI